MFINGIKDYDKNGMPVKTGMFSGPVTSAGEKKTGNSGKVWARASVKLRNNPDGSALFLTIKSFGHCLDTVASLQKGDVIQAAGRIVSSEFNGKKYVDMMVDSVFVVEFAKKAPVPADAGVPVSGGNESIGTDQKANMDALADRMDSMPDFDFAETGDSEELPF